MRGHNRHMIYIISKVIIPSLATTAGYREGHVMNESASETPVYIIHGCIGLRMASE